MKKDKEVSVFKKKMEELKSTTRGKAILKLIRWGIFFLCLFIFCFIASLITDKNSIIDNSNNTQNKTKLTEDEMLNKLQEKLANSNFNYEYNVTINNEKIIFNGTKTNEAIIGYKNTNMGIIKYVIDKSGTYQEIVNEKIPLSNLYEGLNEEYFNINKLINIIKKIKFTKDNDSDFIYPTFNGKFNDIIFTISLSAELNNADVFIRGINIKTADITYDFNFDNVKEQNS